MIDKTTIDKILDATNIVDVVSDFVSLKKRGTSYLGLCPFHNERTPSFSVSASRGIFKCFSCGKAGSAVSFLMDLESMSYVEAIKWLARKYNIEVKERELSSEEKAADAARESMFAVNEFALNHFEDTLVNTDEGRNVGLAYFTERGISDAMIKKFHLGYAIDRPDDLYKKALSKGFEEKYLIETGLAIKTDRGTLYDRFKGRVIYPVHSLSGRVVAFGGRTLRKEKTVAKYVNSPESTIYSKSRELYGIYQARNAIAKKKDCILVEGYMDVISMHQAGVENVVASSGTSLTEGQIRMIKRFADSVTLIYDSDPAGIKASLRGIDMLLAAGLSLKVVLLPEGDDPDSFAQAHTSSEVEAYIESHRQDLIGFKADILMADAGSDPRKRSEAINDILRSIAIIPDLVEQSVYLDECARKVGVEASTLSAQLKKFVMQRAEDAYNKRRTEQAAKSLETGPGVTEPIALSTPQPEKSPAESSAAHGDIPHPIYLAEEDLMRHILRHGFMYMCDLYDGPDDQEGRPMSVVEYVEAEMKIHDVEFVWPRFKRLWQLVTELRQGDWPAEYDREYNRLLEKRNADFNDGLELIRRGGHDIESINKLEEDLNNRLDNEFDRAIDDYSSAYIRRELLKTDNRALIDIVATLTSEPIVLSKMYPKEDENEETRKKVPMALRTLVGAHKKVRLLEIAELLKTVTDPTEIRNLLEEYQRVKTESMEFDKVNGEIVITPN